MVDRKLKYIVTTLDSIDGRMAELLARIVRIETSLGIEQPKHPSNPKPAAQP